MFAQFDFCNHELKKLSLNRLKQIYGVYAHFFCTGSTRTTRSVFL